MIKNIVFDFGRVIVDFNEEYMTSIYLSDKSKIKEVKEIVFDRLYWDKLDEGTITDDEVRQGICNRLPEHFHKEAISVYDNWYHNLSFIEGIPEIIKNLKLDGYKLYLLSNISSRFAQGYNEVPQLTEIFSSFDGLVFSAPIGMIKPNKEIFEYLLEKYSLNAEECLFIDDNKNNILSAKFLGFNTYLFDGDALKLSEFLSEI